MGNLLFAEKKVDFQQLKTIRAAFNVAFGGRFEPIFEQNSRSLVTLEAVRNLFAHKGGKIDQAFVQRVKNDETFRNRKEGDLLSVDGGYVCSQCCHCNTLRDFFNQRSGQMATATV